MCVCCVPSASDQYTRVTRRDDMISVDLTLVGEESRGRFCSGVVALIIFLLKLRLECALENVGLCVCVGNRGTACPNRNTITACRLLRGVYLCVCNARAVDVVVVSASRSPRAFSQSHFYAVLASVFLRVCVCLSWSWVLTHFLHVPS